ncbi:MAG: hypothetical protein V8R14_00290 [Clostridia bacterium]
MKWQRQLRKASVSVNSWGPKEILRESGKVTGVIFKKCVSAVTDEGRFIAPEYDERDILH